MLKIVLLGGGNIAHHLFRVFNENNSINVVQCYNRSLSAIKVFEDKTRVTNELADIIEADIYVIAVSDNAIADISNELPFSNKLVVHTSGNVSMLDLNEKNKRGVFYPLQSFSIDKEVNFEEIPICIEAENDTDLKMLQTLAASISNKVYKIDSKQRKAIHLSAVFVNNFVNHMYQIGNEICKQNDIPFDILQPLIEETSEKIKTLTPEESQTGPAKRNDTKTINSHLELLEKDAHKEIYKLLTTSIINSYGRKEL
ncbi:Rossmann-like and DUF2520 domain-containing protein [Joostella sp.]|uniref:Rossmann-like and DUF2520 domain-containing protein n=1 Tax=Joostella sp. TaxID=2231138 RepID=UPI003A90E5E1